MRVSEKKSNLVSARQLSQREKRKKCKGKTQADDRTCHSARPTSRLRPSACASASSTRGTAAASTTRGYDSVRPGFAKHPDGFDLKVGIRVRRSVAHDVVGIAYTAACLVENRGIASKVYVRRQQIRMKTNRGEQ